MIVSHESAVMTYIYLYKNKRITIHVAFCFQIFDFIINKKKQLPFVCPLGLCGLYPLGLCGLGLCGLGFFPFSYPIVQIK